MQIHCCVSRQKCLWYIFVWQLDRVKWGGYMPEIHLMTVKHTYWKETISFAERRLWKAGFFLARKMQENEFQEWEGNWL